MTEKQELRELIDRIVSIVENHNDIYLEIVKKMQKMGDYADLTEIKNVLNSEFEKIELFLKFVVTMEEYAKGKIFHHDILMNSRRKQR